MQKRSIIDVLVGWVVNIPLCFTDFWTQWAIVRLALWCIIFEMVTHTYEPNAARFFKECLTILERYALTLSWRRSYHIETSPLICRANQWTGFYMIATSVIKELSSDTRTNGRWGRDRRVDFSKFFGTLYLIPSKHGDNMACS